MKIPRGVDTGSRVKLSGKGPNGRDIVVIVRMAPHAIYQRRGADLERELPVTLREALLGAEVPVTTLKGRILLTIPAGTQSGKTFRLSGQGMPRMKDGGAGDLYLRVRVVLPPKLDERQSEAARSLPRPRRPARSAGHQLTSDRRRTNENRTMQLDRFTEKAQEAIVTAQQLAERMQSPVLDAEHLLAALAGPGRRDPRRDAPAPGRGRARVP